jgi:uncharacterized beta-barrel protein YwiB (DUF1934 family)
MFQKKNSVGIERAQKMSEEELQEKIITGVFVDKEQNNYLQRYKEVIDKAKQINQ